MQKSLLAQRCSRARYRAACNNTKWRLPIRRHTQPEASSEVYPHRLELSGEGCVCGHLSCPPSAAMSFHRERARSSPDCGAPNSRRIYGRDLEPGLGRDPSTSKLLCLETGQSQLSSGYPKGIQLSHLLPWVDSVRAYHSLES